MKEEVVEFESCGQRLFGVLTNPDADDDRLVIMLHGGPGGDHQGPSEIFSKLASALARQGVSSLRFDFRGSGYSDGDFVDTTIHGEVLDLEAALHMVLARGYKRLGLLGESMGGTIAVLGCNDHFQALVLWYPAIELLETSLQQYFSEERAEELQSEGFIADGDICIGWPFLEEVKTLSLQHVLPTIRQPVLFIHGDNDEDVPHTQSVNAAKLVNGPCHVEIVKRAGHCLRRPKEQKRAIDHTVQWFSAHLN